MGLLLIPALIAVTTMSLLVSLLYLYLFLRNRDRLLRLWGEAWGIYTLRFVVMTAMVLHVLPSWMVVVQEAATLAGAFLCLSGAASLGGQPVAKGWRYGAWACLGWIAVTPVLHLPFFWSDLPGALFTGLLFAWSGVTILRQGQISGTGKVVAGYALILWGIHRADYPFLRPVEWFAPWGFLIASVLFLAAAIGILLLYYEKVHAALEKEIRERSLAQASLAESEEKYRLLVENAREGVYVLQEGIYKYANGICGETLGVPVAELIGSSVLEFIHPNDREKSIAQHLRFLNGELSEARADFRVLTRHGEERWVDVNSVRISWGGKTATLNFATDITERKRAEEEKAKLHGQLLQSRKMEAIGQLAGGVAHDFSNMLGVILGHTEIALDRLDPSDPLNAHLAEIRKAAQRSSDLTGQLLAFARKQMVSPKVLDINETLAGMLKMLQRLIGEDIRLAWLPGVNLWPVKMDPTQIDQILANLSVNARDAINGVGKVTIETGNMGFDEAYCTDHPGFVPGEYVLLSVSDDGCGMDQETLDKLFEPFFTTKEVGKGTGLGLATVYGIVRQNQGFIHVYSEPNQGTTFKIYLPRHAGQVEEAPAEGSQAPVTGGHETILLVEDEPALLELSRLILEGLGYRVLAAGTPVEAIRLAEGYAGEIHLLMTDVVMPEMNGRDLAGKMFSRSRSLKFLFMSGYTANVIAHHGVLEEGVHFIQKPFSRKDLAAKVREALDQG